MMTNNVPFMGETMTCVMCGKQKKSNPFVESGWTSVDADNTRYYVCPAELPGAKGSKKQFAAAYEKIFLKIADLHQRDARTVYAVLNTLGDTLDSKFGPHPSVPLQTTKDMARDIVNLLWGAGELTGYKTIDEVHALVQKTVEAALAKAGGG